MRRARTLFPPKCLLRSQKQRKLYRPLTLTG
jgi:hypothetical protein